MNLNNIDFNQLKQTILPYFIEIYGEKHKDIIIEKMNKIEPIFYSTIDSKKSVMYIQQNAKKVELTLKFLEHNKIELSKEIKDEIIRDNSTYRLKEVEKANKILRFCFDTYEYADPLYKGMKIIANQPTDIERDKEKSIEALKELGIIVNKEEYNDWLLTAEAKETFEKINQLKEYISILDEDYKEFNNQFIDLQSLIDKSNVIENNINQKYMLQFLKSNEQYMNENDKQLLNQYINSNDKDWYSFKSNMSIFKFMGSSFYDNSLLESFSKDSYEILADTKASRFRKQTIIDNRIAYYKLMGIYNEKTSPEEFVFSNDVILKNPQPDVIDDIIASKKHFCELANTEYLSITSSYEDNLRQINNLGLVTESSFTIDSIKNNINFINPNVRIVNDQPEAVALLCFSPGACLPQYIDTMFIHEINHAIELSLLDYDNGKANYKCGFEELSDDEEEERNYEQSSETVNQLIAIEITEAMHKDNVYLFDNPNISKTRGGTSYEQQRLFLEPFWNKFKYDIIEARIDNNMDSLFRLVGKDNFEDLNNIINEYKQMPYYNMMDDLINKKDTELTRKREELIVNTIKTFDLMNEQANKKDENETLTKITM